MAAAAGSSARILPALQALCGKSLFFTSADATEFCSYVLPELGSKLTIVDPERLLLNQIPLEPVVQFYLDAPRDRGMTVTAHAEFLYGEDRITPSGPARRACCGTPAPSAGPTGCWPLGWSRTPPSRDSTWSRTKSRCTACWKRACPP